MASDIQPGALSGEDIATAEHHIEGSRVVAPDYGMPGSKGMAPAIVPLMWLLIPFVFCLGYGILTR